MTILGQHSVTELKSLLAAKDSEIADMDKAFTTFGPTWSKADGPTYRAWFLAYTLFKSAYNIAWVEAKAAILAGELVPFVSDDNIPAETAYQGVMYTVLNTGTDGKVNPGGLQDLFDQIQAAQKNAGVAQYTETAIVQPPKGSDTDLAALQAANAAAKAIEDAKKKAAAAASSPYAKGLLIGGIALLGLAGITAIKSVTHPF